MRILVIEDNKDLCDSMCFQLQNEGYTTDTCYTGEHALYYAMQQSYDVIILDRMLPVMDGLSILKAIRQKNINVPVIMVTAMDGIHNRIDGLDSGADDYLVKPFAIEELLARIRALVRRPQKIEQTEVITFSNLSLDVKQQYIKAGDKTCSLSKRETELLEYFIRNSNQILTREMILAHVWGPDNFVEEGNLDNYIHFLRRRLKSVLSSVQIKTIHSVGYRLEESI
ncbi:response regulator transcription factor [Anaerocolumna jejuensis]|uniref:response regulator transcription factor n=1 Tax=Anaerocolumna jejuensis TaxID=259063 RepID=UPI003F7C01E1